MIAIYGPQYFAVGHQIGWFPKQVPDPRDYRRIFLATIVGFLIYGFCFLGNFNHQGPFDCSLFIGTFNDRAMCAMTQSLAGPFKYGVIVFGLSLLYRVLERLLGIMIASGEVQEMYEALKVGVSQAEEIYAATGGDIEEAKGRLEQYALECGVYLRGFKRLGNWWWMVDSMYLLENSRCTIPIEASDTRIYGEAVESKKYSVRSVDN